MGKNSNLAVVTTSDHWQKVPQASAAAFTVPADGDRLGRELYVVGDDMKIKISSRDTRSFSHLQIKEPCQLRQGFSLIDVTGITRQSERLGMESAG